MKTRYIQLSLLTLCLVGLSNIVSAQNINDYEPVPSYKSQADMPPKMSPQKKAMLHFPEVKLNEDDTQNVAQFKMDMTKWKQSNASLIQFLETPIQKLVISEDYANLAVLMTENAKMNTTNNNKGGK